MPGAPLALNSDSQPQKRQGPGLVAGAVGQCGPVRSAVQPKALAKSPSPWRSLLSYRPFRYRRNRDHPPARRTATGTRIPIDAIIHAMKATKFRHACLIALIIGLSPGD